MKLETFFEKFDQFADAPDAVKKMRELVLQLAVTGKLVAQEKRDKPASSLVESAEAERAKLVAARKIKARPTAPVEADEQPYELPSSWAWARVSDVGCELGQKVPDKRFTYIDVGGIDSDKGRISDRVEKLEPGDAPSRARKLVTRGTVIYSTVRPYLLNIAIVDQDFDPEPIASTAFGILHPFEGVNNRYLFYWLRSAPFTAYVQAGMKGMAYPAINDEKFYSGPIALPPLAEQKRIVAKVDELMALCDRLEAQQQERETRHAALARASLARFADAPTPANLPFLFHPSYAIPPADLRKSILTLAVQGKLVPQDPNDEPAATSSESESLFEIPTSWQWHPLGTLGLCRTGKTPPTSDPTNFGVGFPFIGPGQITANGNFTSPEKTITSKGLENSTEANVSDILMVCIGGSIGKAAICRKHLGFNQQINSVRLKRDLPEFVYLAVTAEYFQEQVLTNASGSATPIINKGKWERIPVPIPPLAEQHRIVAKVEQLMALVDALETQIAASRTTAANLLSALVAELTGTKLSTAPKQPAGPSDHMKNKTSDQDEHRIDMEPLNITTKAFVLRRFAMTSEYRSLGEFDCTYHSEEAGPQEASPICLVGLNGSGKSNLIEAVAEVFCFLELINLPWKKLASASSRYRENRHLFELEYTLTDDEGERLIRVRKTKKKGADFFLVRADNTEEAVEPGRPQLLLLPRRVIGYSSGLNETVSHPFLRTKTIYSEEVRDAAPPDGVDPSQGGSVFDTRTLYMDYESNAAVIICNYIFRKAEDLDVFNKFTRVSGVSSFGLRFNRKRAGKNGPNSIVRLTRELQSYQESFVRCAGAKWDPGTIAYNLDFKLTPETTKRFREEFETAENLFMAMHRWSLLNALILSDKQRGVYLSADITKGALERPPSVPPSDRVFNIVDLKLNLSVPATEIDYSGLSDGEHQFMQIIGTALLFSDPGTLFLLDEPESHFNPEWRTKFNLILNRLPNARSQEYIVSTHSPFVVSGSRMGNVYKFERTGGDIKCAPVQFETYGASFDVLLKNLFSINSLIDQSAREDLERIIKSGDVTQMQAAVGDFAESKEKRRLYEAIIQKEEGK